MAFRVYSPSPVLESVSPLLPHVTSTYLGDSGIYHLHVVIVEGLSNERPVFPVHSKALYSNIAFALLRYVVEVITGPSYEEAVDKYVTKPLGMENTTLKPLSEASMVISQLPDDLNWWQTYFHGHNPSVSPLSLLSPSVRTVADASI